MEEGRGPFYYLYTSGFSRFGSKPLTFFRLGRWPFPPSPAGCLGSMRSSSFHNLPAAGGTTLAPGRSRPDSEKATSMIGLCQEAKTLLTRSGGARVQVLQKSSARLVASRLWFLFDLEPDFHLLAQFFRLPRRLSWCTPASLETFQREHRELTLLRPVAFPARPGRRRAEETLTFRTPTQRCGFRFLLPGNLVGDDRLLPGTPPACVPRRESPDSGCLSVSPGRRGQPNPG